MAAIESEEVELVSKAKCKSPAWSYFRFKPGPDGKPDDEATAVCRLCKRSVAAKGGNTSNLFSHLKKQHPCVYIELSAASSVERDLSHSQRGSQSQQHTSAEAISSAQKYSHNSRRWLAAVN